MISYKTHISLFLLLTAHPQYSLTLTFPVKNGMFKPENLRHLLTPVIKTYNKPLYLACRKSCSNSLLTCCWNCMLELYVETLNNDFQVRVYPFLSLLKYTLVMTRNARLASLVKSMISADNVYPTIILDKGTVSVKNVDPTKSISVKTMVDPTFPPLPLWMTRLFALLGIKNVCLMMVFVCLWTLGGMLLQFIVDA